MKEDQNYLRAEVLKICEPKMTKEEVAKKVSLSSSLFNKWINGRNDLGDNAINRIKLFLLEKLK